MLLCFKKEQREEMFGHVVFLTVNSRYCALFSYLKQGPKHGGVLGLGAGSQRHKSAQSLGQQHLCPQTVLKCIHPFPGIPIKLSTKSPCVLFLN